MTNAASTANGVRVYQDSAGFRRVVARENDPVDLDGEACSTTTTSSTRSATGCAFRNGTGINREACTCATLPILGTTWNLSVSFGANTLATFQFLSETQLPGIPLFGGELLIGPPAFDVPPSIPLPLSASFYGYQVSVQGLRLDFNGVDLLLVLTNAQDAVLGL